MPGEGQSCSVHRFKGGEQVGLISQVGIESLRGGVGVGAVAHRVEEGVEADREDAVSVRARSGRDIAGRAGGNNR